MTAGRDRPMSPCLLFFLFANQLDVGGHTPQVGTSTGIAPCHDNLPVRTRALATMLLATAFWELREAGLVRLYVEKKWLLIARHTYVRVTLLGDGDGDVPGLEGQLLATMHRNPYEGKLRAEMKEKTLERLDSSGRADAAGRMRQRAKEHQHHLEQHLYVERVVPHWFGDHYSHPEMHVIEVMREVAVAFGFMSVEETKRGGLAGLGGTDRTYRSNCSRITEEKEQFEETLARWQRFRRSDPDLCTHLVQHCERGIIKALRSRGN